ncbi:MAG: B12-binding domain-containing radical SAM protein [Candidatus Omnitrophica bacterium]|nr:B12-binding domain-containing radical SAM protein [Candidatus Omnitrophota bacterium]
MNILFLNPPFIGRFSRTSRSPAVTKGGTLYYPIWLAYATGVAEEDGHHVVLIDAPACGVGMQEVEEKLNSFSPALIVIDTSTPSIYSDINVAVSLKKKFPNSFIVLVGTHPSALPEQTLRIKTEVDAVAIGEYDYTIKDLAHALEDKKGLDTVDGLAFRSNNSICINKQREKIKSLDDVPFVSSVYKRHLNPRHYFFAAANYPMVMIITGRGCPYICHFCVYPQVFHSRQYRVRSPENVAAEFEFIRSNFPGVKEIGIEDDCFTANKDHVRNICSLLIKNKNRIKWYCNARGDIEYELLKHMKEAGCRLVTVGFESGVQTVLDTIDKRITVEKYYQFARDAKKADILVHGCLMVGNPHDTKETLAQSYAFAKKINCDSMQFYPLYVYPGTEAYHWARNNNYLKTDDFSKWLTEEGLHNCVLDIPGLSSTDMVQLCDDYLKKYHLRPEYIAMKLMQAIRNPSEGYRSLKSAKVFFSKLFSGKIR